MGLHYTLIVICAPDGLAETGSNIEFCCLGLYAGILADLQSNIAARQQQAAQAIAGIALRPQSNKDAIIAAGALPLLLALLRSDQAAVQKTTAGAMWIVQNHRDQHELLRILHMVLNIPRMQSLQHGLCLYWLHC